MIKIQPHHLRNIRKNKRWVRGGTLTGSCLVSYSLVGLMVMVWYCPLKSKRDAKKRLAELAHNINKITDVSVTSKKEGGKYRKKKFSDSESGDEIAGLLNFI